MKIVCIILAVLCFFMFIGGGVLVGCAEILQPFNAMPLGAILIAFGMFGTIGFIIGTIAIYVEERARW